MALSISQMVTVSFPAVLNDSKKAKNQFAENAFLAALKKHGMIKTEPFGTIIEHSLDYRRNPGAEIMSTDGSPVSLAKTEILTASQFDPASIVVPITWTFQDEVKNASENQKVKLVSALIENALTSHDDLIEEALFSTSTNGLLGLQTLVPDSGQGTVGGIDASVETWHRNYSATYASAGTNIQAQMTKAANNASRGTGGKGTKLIVSGADAQGIYEGTLQAQVRYEDGEMANLGFKVLKFKSNDYVFSPYGGTRIYFLNADTCLYMAQGASRQLKDTLEVPHQTAYTRKMFTMLQFTTKNKRRNSLLTQV